MINFVKKLSVVGLTLSSIMTLCPTTAMEPESINKTNNGQLLTLDKADPCYQQINDIHELIKNGPFVCFAIRERIIKLLKSAPKSSCISAAMRLRSTSIDFCFCNSAICFADLIRCRNESMR